MAILVDNLAATDHFRLHIKQMQIDSATVQRANSDMIDLTEAFEYPANEYYVLRSGDGFPEGKYYIEIGKRNAIYTH